MSLFSFLPSNKALPSFVFYYVDGMLILMRILIATGVYPPDIGGPAEYAKNLRDEFTRLGHIVAVVSYSGLERSLPFGIRHLVYFFKVFVRAVFADFIITLDTFSVAVPSILASVILRKKNVIRVSGDFLWESYVERSGDLVTFSKFYLVHPKLNFKERLIFRFMKFAFREASSLAFNSEWQRSITVSVYGLDFLKTTIILNFFGDPLPAQAPSGKNFVWAVRPIKLKNGDVLRRAFAKAQETDFALSLDDAVTSHEKLFERLASCYAVILPSVSEVSPNLILDALRFGKPFILTRESGLYEMLKDVGLFVDPLNSDDITEKILMLSDDATYKLYQSKAQHFSFRHSWEEIAKEFLELYKKP